MNIALISPNYNKYSETFINAHKNLLKGNIYYYYGGFIPNMLEGIGKINSIIDSLKENNIDLIFTEYGPTGAEMVQYAIKLKIPIIVHFHGYDAYRKDIVKKYEQRYKHIFNYAFSKVIVVSTDMKRQLISLECPEDKIVYAPCGPNDKFKSLDINYKSHNFLSIGRFTDKKAPYITIDAFHKASSKIPNAKLTMIGDGPLLNLCKSLAKTLKIDSKVTFTGSLLPNEVMNHIKSSFCFLQHSIIAENGDSEGTPVAVLEASIAGLPIIATAHAGILDTIVNKKTGILVEEHDTDNMSKAMVELFNNKDLAKKYGIAGTKHISTNYSIKKHINILNSEVENLYKIKQSVLKYTNFQETNKDGADLFISNIKSKEILETIHTNYVNNYIEKHILLTKGNFPIEDLYKSTEIVISTCFRNGEEYITQFVEHHKAIGIKYFVFLDNNSSDNTFDLIKSLDVIYIYVKCNLNFKIFSLSFRKYLADKYGENKWNLVLDIDELFDYPFSNLITIESFIAYLDVNNYSAVVTQMLDMFPSGNIKSTDRINFEAHKYFNLLSIKKERYWLLNTNKVNNKNIKIFRNGIRHKYFDLQGLLLTKHALFKNISSINYKHIHWVENAIIADISSVLYHYKFNSNFKDQIQVALEEKQYFSSSRDYRKYSLAFEDNSPIYLRDKDSQTISSTDELIKLNFLRITSSYLKYIGDNELVLDDKLNYFYICLKDALEFQENKKLPKEKIVYKNKNTKVLEKKVNEIYNSRSYVIGNYLVKISIKYFYWLPFVRKHLK